MLNRYLHAALSVALCVLSNPAAAVAIVEGTEVPVDGLYRAIFSSELNRAGGLYTYLVPISEGTCKSPVRYGAYMSSPGAIDDEVIDFIDGKACDSDPKVISGREQFHLIFGLLSTTDTRYGLPPIGSPGRADAIRTVRTLMNSEEAYSIDSMDVLLADCAGKCSSIKMIAAMFAYAGALEESGSDSAAYQWRHGAIAWAFSREDRSARGIKEVAADHLYAHMARHYVQAVRIGDFSTAQQIAEQLVDEALDIPSTEKVLQHFNAWKLGRDDQRVYVAKEILVEGSWIANSKGAARRGFAGRELSVSTSEGEVEHAFLVCSSESGPKQAYLDLRLSKTWRRPESWDACTLTLIGQPGTSVSIVEGPLGSLLPE